MTSSPEIPYTSPPPSPFLDAGTPPATESSGPQECRLCAQESNQTIGIFSKEGCERGLPEKTRLCLPILITDGDDLSTSICMSCCNQLEQVRAFFETCFNANQELIIQLRKKRGSPLDLSTHINQYVRCYSSPSVPQIKIEPTNYLDVNLGLDQDDEEELDEEEEDDEDLEDEDEDDSEEDFKPNTDALRDFNNDETEKENRKNGIDKFKIPAVPRRRKRGRPRKHISDVSGFYYEGEPDEKPSAKKHSGRGRKKIVPMSLKICSECGEEFQDHASNLTHWKDKHPDKDVVYQCTEQDVTNGQACIFTSTIVEDLFKHRLRHKNKDPTSKESVIECKLCGKYYTQSYLINRHMLVHADLKDFKCPICEKELKTSPDLKEHLRNHETEDVRYTHCCELCGKRFTQRANLDAHLRVHSGYKPFSCDFCGKTFSQKGNMDEHRRVHTGERPFVCELCGTSFVRRSEMALHTRIVHTGERPYQCSFCPKSFQRRDLMRKHERIHTDTRPYACQYCPKTFTQRDKMVVHTRLHTGERPYVCDVCGKGFCESGNLKKHMRVHGKEPPAIMHQNNKGKPAPVQNPAYSGKYNHHGRSESASNLAAIASGFQQLVNDDDNNSNASHSRSESVQSPHPANNSTSTSSAATHHQHSSSNGILPTTASNMGLHLKLEQQQQTLAAAAVTNQYPLSSMAAAAAAAAAANLAHNQLPNHHAHPLMSHHQHHQQQHQQSHHHSSRSTTATPIHDIDAQSDAGSERSVTSPFVPQQSMTSSVVANQHPAHHQQFPYHVHHTLIQHLNEMREMRDLRDWYGHLPSGAGGGGGNNH